MQLLKTIASCLQIDDWQKSYMSATNTEKPEVSKWRSCVEYANTTFGESDRTMMKMSLGGYEYEEG